MGIPLFCATFVSIPTTFGRLTFFHPLHSTHHRATTVCVLFQTTQLVCMFIAVRSRGVQLLS
jgi:hypothetical protein